MLDKLPLICYSDYNRLTTTVINHTTLKEKHKEENTNMEFNIRSNKQLIRIDALTFEVLGEVCDESLSLVQPIGA